MDISTTYLVVVVGSNFSNGMLTNYRNSDGNGMSAPDPDDDQDQDDNGDSFTLPLAANLYPHLFAPE